MENIFLTGFMATGKTAVGRALAERVGRSFVDTDGEIERESGMTIAEIFRRRGEAAFRDLERGAVARACEIDGAVVATGGGAIVDPENLRRMRAAGKIVCLVASREAILARVGEGGDRPLLAGFADRAARIGELLTERARSYAAADWTVDTTDSTPAEVAEAIAARLTPARRGGERTPAEKAR